MTQRGEQSGDSGKAVNREDFIQNSLFTGFFFFSDWDDWIGSLKILSRYPYFVSLLLCS